MEKSLTVAIIQDNPSHLDIKKCLETTLIYLEQAAQKGAQLVVFGETWLGGYPAWLDHCPNIAIWDDPEMKKVYSRFHANSIERDGTELKQIANCAAKHKITVVIGANERVAHGVGNGSVYNALFIISDQGNIVNHHRKLMPTFTEKLLHAQGDGNGLNAVETEFGRLGGLICWEHWMPLSRQAMHESGEHIHIAAWPMVKSMNIVASQHYAFEGRCFVIAVGQIMKVSNIPGELDLPKKFLGKPDDLVLKGGSCIIRPNGEFELEPNYDRSGMILHTIQNLDQTVGERMALDTSGHYNRRDIFEFKIDKNRK